MDEWMDGWMEGRRDTWKKVMMDEWMNATIHQ
jgi:hypothetical protein